MESDYTELFERIVDTAQELGGPREFAVGQYAVVPKNSTVVDLSTFAEKYLPAPKRKKARAILQDAASFCEYWKRFSEPNSLLFGDPNTTQFIAWLDYHGGHDQAAGWRDHTAHYVLQETADWRTWIGSNGKKMSQADFAQFIEDNTPDIIKPSAADMMEIAREMTAKKDVEFSSGTRLKDGRNEIRYTENVSANLKNGQMEVPEFFTIRIVAYTGTTPVEVQARLRYRIEQAKLTLWYDLLRPHKVKEAAFNAALKSIQEGCGTTVLLGSA